MSVNFNKIILGGRIANDLELKTTGSGTSVCQFNLAVGRGKDTTDFFTCVAWRKTAETLTNFFHKGSQIIVEGKMTTRQWEDKNKNKRTAYEVQVDNINFVDNQQVAAAPAPANVDYTPLEMDEELPF